MIYHEKFGQTLRLGNFLFKFAWSVGMKEKYGYDTTYPQYYLWDYLETSPIIGENKAKLTIQPRKYEWTQEEQDCLESFDYKSGDYAIALAFFMQSVNWWKDYQNEVRKALTFKQSVLDNIKIKYSELMQKPFILISIRLGTDFFGTNMYYSIPPDWYFKVLKKFDLQKYNVLVTSDNIEQAKQIFGNSFFYAEPNTTWNVNQHHYYSDASEHFILGTLSSHQIISNSTFSWWQAFLSEGDTFHTGRNFHPNGPSGNIDNSDYYHPNWVKIEV